MNTIMSIKGKVKFPITLDAGVWIFDDRRIDLNTYFTQDKHEDEEEEEFTVVSKHWDRVIKEGSVAPPTLKSERQFEKVKVLTGTFGIKFEPFLINAEPLEDANVLVIETETEDISIPLEEGYHLILQYSKEGKPLREDGPVHILYPDGSNRQNPIKLVRAFRVE
ncbi:peptidyl-prolyl cis-trans isomerase [Bacillus sp. FJAT-49732]|uniref:Peptidyl-prolyl cis-trans isomerase n=1 Tax=Lederbergia citrisecunda TaxID=2833583 RepID=A0A942TMA7_9BACI|nr:peptidyl-prolyl cis-trans isomerase [Lederbergia citrisecunda]MBS4198819.1 peptidyl-prolyl cis-trans isomerase [Lederbergia citrisecunda]